MKIKLPILEQRLVEGEVESTEKSVDFEIDTSVYSEERWEQHFPVLASHEGLFQYIERIQQTPATEKVRVASMLKAVYCFIESDEVPTYKDFAKLFILSAPSYTERLIQTLKTAFDRILNTSSVKN